jgi:hypothetical protein
MSHFKVSELLTGVVRLFETKVQRKQLKLITEFGGRGFGVPDDFSITSNSN